MYKKLNLILLILILSLLSLSNLFFHNLLKKTYGQVSEGIPKLSYSPNPAIADSNGDPVRFTITNCTPGSIIQFRWLKDNWDSSDNYTNGKLIRADSNGQQSFSNPNGFTKGSYTIAGSCGGVNASAIVMEVVSQNDAQCSILESKSFEADSESPYTIDTRFSFSAKIITDCGDKRFTLNAVSTEDDNNVRNIASFDTFRSGPDGTLTKNDIVIDEIGTWEIILAGHDVTFASVITTVTITDEAGTELSCGSPCTANSNTCEDDCACAQTSSGDWKCGGDSLAEPEENECGKEMILPDAPCPNKCPYPKPVGDGKFVCDQVPPPGPPCAKIETFRNGDWFPEPDYDPKIENLPKDEYGDILPFRCVQTYSAFDTIDIDQEKIVGWLLGFLLSISGVIALVIILRSGYQFMTSSGNPEAIQEARERIISAIVGLLFIIFTLVILEVIGVDILGLPGFGGA